MNREQLEFSISQYLDGTLSSVERSALEQRFESDGDARALLAEYRSVNDLLRIENPLPELHWDRLAEHLSASLAGVERSARRDAESYPIRQLFAAGLALAASLLIATGVAFVIFRQSPKSAATPTEIVQIQGPRSEPATAPAIAEISIGPADQLAASEYSSEPMVSQPSRTISIAPDASGADDNRGTLR